MAFGASGKSKAWSRPAQHFAAILTPQAKVTRPNGAPLVGPEEISASHEKSFADNVFVAGGVIRAELVQTDGQWKISQLRYDVVWRAGGFRDMMQTGQ